MSTTAPITLAEAKTHLRITHSDDDVYIAALLLGITELCEQMQRRIYIRRTVVEYFDSFPAVIRPVYSPLVSPVTSIKYYDTGGVEQTLAADQYQVDYATEPGRIMPAYNCSWPSIRSVLNAVTLTYVAGYSAAIDDTSDVPADIKHAIKLLLTHYYENRSAVEEVKKEQLPRGFDSLITLRKVY
jgi:uncharacterized phiE125 gp8 family phage protein